MSVLQFKQHFLASELFRAIINDPNIEPIMIYITGSILTRCTDDQSDIDLCVLIREKPVNQPDYQRQTVKYFANYTPENRICHWVYNDLSEIQQISTSPLDNIGWAQFKYLDESLILYKNPKYIHIINNLFKQCEVIVKNSIYLFLHSFCNYLQLTCPADITDQHLTDISKAAYHLVWASSELDELVSSTSANTKFLMKLKRNNYSTLTESEKHIVRLAIQKLQNFFMGYKQVNIMNFEEDL